MEEWAASFSYQIMTRRCCRYLRKKKINNPKVMNESKTFKRWLEQTFGGKEYLTECEMSGWSIRIHIVFLTFLPSSIRSQISSAFGSAATHQAKTPPGRWVFIEIRLIFHFSIFLSIFCTSASSSMSCTLPNSVTGSCLLNAGSPQRRRRIPQSKQAAGGWQTPHEYQKAFKLITIKSPSRSDSTRWCRPWCSRDTNTY